MKTILLATAILLCFIPSKAQFQGYEWSNAFDNTTNTFHEGIYGNPNGEFVLVYADREKSIGAITLHSGKFNTAAVSSTNFEFKSKVNSIIGAMIHKGSVTVFTESIEGKESGSTTQFIQAYVFENGSLKSEKTLYTFTAENKQHFGKQRFIQSPDLSKSLLFIESPFKAGKKEEINLLVYDANGKETLNKTVQLDLDAKPNLYNYPEISNGGAIYFLKKDKEKNVFRYFIYAFNESTNTFSHKQITLANANITEIKGQVTPKGEFLVGGFFASEPIHEFEGYYLFKFDQNCAQKFKTQAVFDESTFLKFLSKKEYSKDPAIKNFFMDNILVLETGKIVIEAEFYSEEEFKDKSLWTNYKDVMLICFDENGKYKTTYNHKKNQSQDGKHQQWASYMTYGYNDTIAVLHNNMVKTEGLGHPEPVLQMTFAHELKGLKIKPLNDFDRPGENPFYTPELALNQGFENMILGFSDFKKNQIKLAFIQLRKSKE